MTTIQSAKFQISVVIQSTYFVNDISSYTHDTFYKNKMDLKEQKRSKLRKIQLLDESFDQILMLNPEFHWLRQIATTLCKFHWQFWIFLDAIAKAKKLICKSKAQNLKQVSLTKSFFSFGNGI